MYDSRIQSLTFIHHTTQNIKTIDVYSIYKYVAQQKENHKILFRIKQQLSIGNIHTVFPCIIGKVNLDRKDTKYILDK